MMASEDTGKPAHNIDSCDTECASPHFTRASEDTGKPAHNIDSCDTEGAPEDAGRPAPNIDSGVTECKRLVIPTEKGRQYFADSCETYKRKLNDLVSHLDTYARLTSETITAWPRLQKVETSQRLSEIFSKFQNLSDEYLNFLARHNTEESALEQSHHSYLRKTYADRVSTYTLLLSVRDNDRISQGSVCSGKSRSKSCRSTGSAASVSTLVDKRMKAEAARARLQFIRRETELQCSAAAIQANMNELAAYKEVAVAEAELSVINDEVSDTRTHFSDTNTHFSSSPHQTYIKPRHSTPGDAAPPTQLPLYSDIPASEVTRPGLVGSPVAQQFVPASCVEQVMHQSHSVPVPPIDNSDISGTQVTQLIRQGVVSNPASLQFVPGFHVDQVLHQSQHASVAPVDRANIFVPQMTPLIRPGVVSNPVSQQFVPISHEKHAVHPSHDAPVPLVNKGQPLPSISELPGVTGVHTQHAPVSSQGHGQPFPSVGGLIGASGDQSQHVLYDFTRLLLKKDLVTKMEAFDDKPEHFATWKAGFHRTVYELGVTPPEEQDLLVKWLGPSSSGEARSIRSSHAHDPVAGCRAIWARLEERYGAPEKVEASIKQKLEALGTVGNQDPEALYRLVDILGEIEAFKTNPLYRNLLAYYDSSSGVSPIVTKLPYNLQDKWTTRAFQYKQRHQVPYPPFSFFANFVREMSSMRNDPSLVNEQSKSRSFRQQPAQPRRKLGSTKKTDVAVTQAEPSVGRQNDLEHNCPIHNSSHSLNECIKFKKMPLDKRREYLRLNGICFKCCISKDHQARSCTMWKPCSACQSTRHPSAMHLQKNEERHNAPQEPPTDAAAEHGGEGPATKVSAKCTRLCGVISGGRSCSKVVLVQVYPAGCPEDAVSVYAILDDQSNHTLAQPELLDQLGVESPPMPYTLSSCAGVTETAGRMASGFTVAAMDGSVSHALPVMVECSDIPGNTQEIPTSEVAQAHPHLSRIADQLYPLQQVGIELLIGRDLLEAHHVHDQIVGPRDTPFAQKLSLGWVIVGDVCLEGRHRPSVTVMKTHVQSDGRGTIFESCGSTLHIEVLSPFAEQRQELNTDDFFQITKDDDKTGTSVEDREFISMMNNSFRKNERGEWSAPLPFKMANPKLPNNRVQALRRSKALDHSLQRNPRKLSHMLQFMEKIFRCGAAEPAPPIEDDRQCWYLPIFGVYHPKKPDQVRGVFDSSVVFAGESLNEALLTGPNLTNSLLGILLRFRREKFAIAGDIQQMFYRFFVEPEHRDYLRFFWYQQNDPKQPLVEYRMKVHVFGNRPSPAVATYGLRRAVQDAELDVKHFVERDFYVDDALTSRPVADEVISLMKRTQDVLKEEGDIRLHKIVSNDPGVMQAFPTEDLGKETKDLTLCDDSVLLQHSLGLQWDLKSDSFLFSVPQSDVPYTRRGILSRINSIFDPMGFLSPLTICGKILLRQMCPSGAHWDDPLSEDFHDAWMRWNQCVEDLNDLRLSRMFVSTSLSGIEHPCILVFSDASETAIAASAYLMTEKNELGFIMGKTKLAPLAGHSIPRLELCGAVLATEIGQFVSDHLDIPLSTIQYFSDSKVVLGYIRNRTRRFYTYVSNRVARIHKVSSPEQWSYVPTHSNPADRATRGSLPDVRDCLDLWLKGPTHLLQHSTQEDSIPDFNLIAPDDDPDVRPEVVVKKSDVSISLTPLLERFEKFSTWKSLTSALSTLRHVAAAHGKSQNVPNTCHGWHQCEEAGKLEFKRATEEFLIRHIQHQAFPRECAALGSGKDIPRDSSILSLSPYLDDMGLLRVGGRLNNLRESLGISSVNPVIVPKGHVALLLARFFHEKTSHQGRGLTEGMIRSNGYWIVGAKRLIMRVIYDCVMCRKLRRKPEEQKMADLPLDRLTPGPPFTGVGVDVFGPWSVVTRKTRGGAAQSKRWAVLFSCLTTRAVHIELIEDMSSSCFINALRRLVALRGPVKIFRSDRGTNFVGAADDIGVHVVNVEEGPVKSHLKENTATWIFNAPHASHMGGVWERAIGVARRILDSMLLKEGQKDLTHEVISTLMCEVCAIMNSRPVAVLDSDPSDPLVLSPSMLLTQKQGDTATLTEGLSQKDMYKSQWKHVQVLSDIFWKKWREGYLQALQTRRKWNQNRKNLKNGDFILLRDKICHRNDWSTAVVEKTLPSDDGLVRKATVRMIRDGVVVRYTRPVSEMVLLLD